MSEQPQHYSPTYINNPGHPYSYAQGQPVYIVQAKSTLVAYLLFIFLWWLGAHKFYLRQPFMGIFYLVGNAIAAALTAGIPFVGWISYAPLAIVMLWDLFTIPVRVGYLNALMKSRATYRS
ncbi:TM2 domain-containing protein [Rothia sp. CCM 9417]|uniref:TM2 domain-containing protein n=1 Tax=unclassified Rothia (in: high G+C Gram-positive bacteria) TaxID=2689056 RepID=UPI003ACDB6F9